MENSNTNRSLSNLAIKVLLDEDDIITLVDNCDNHKGSKEYFKNANEFQLQDLITRLLCRIDNQRNLLRERSDISKRKDEELKERNDYVQVLKEIITNLEDEIIDLEEMMQPEPLTPGSQPLSESGSEKSRES